MLKWPENTIRRASVNSFGYGGTNAHVILEAADDYLDNTMLIRHLCEDIGDSPHIVPPVAETCGYMTTPHINGHSVQQTSLEPSSTINISKPRLFPFSHNHKGGIAALAANFKRHISNSLLDTDESMDSLAFTLSDRRSSLDFRFCVTACSREELLESLEKIATGSDQAQKYDELLELCFVFTGMTTTI